jgi:hypothetical protein
LAYFVEEVENPAPQFFRQKWIKPESQIRCIVRAVVVRDQKQEAVLADPLGEICQHRCIVQRILNISPNPAFSTR